MSLTTLIVEDEPGLVLTLSDLFQEAGFEVETASDGSDGLVKGLRRKFDLVVIDWMLPTMFGTEVCRRLRESGVKSAILMLTARSETWDRIEGLQRGADAYVTKPFSPEELLARVHALLRPRFDEQRSPTITTFADVKIDFQRRELKKAGDLVHLNRKEWQLLRYMVTHQEQLVTREQLLANVWGYKTGIESRTVDMHMAWLRQKLEQNPQAPRHFHTIRGRGFRFTLSSENVSA